MQLHKPVDRDTALRRVLDRRDTGRARPKPIRIAAATAGAVAAIAALPMIIVLPELGIPLLLIALRLLAVEFDWAARSYAWVIWRWSQARHWFANASKPARTATAVVLIAIAIALIWILAHELL